MNVVLLAKWVPNPEGVPELGPDLRLRREGMEGGLDPGDEYGVEAALQIAERTGGEVTVVSMGPEPATAAIRKALSMGVHRGVLVTDDALKGADALVTARVLAAAIRRSPFDLVIAGVESTDGSTGTVPMTVAELLGVGSATFARGLDLKDGTVTIERQTEAGYDVVECPLPAVVTVTAGATTPRYPTLKGIMQAKQKPVDRLTVTDLGLSPEEVRPTQEVLSVSPAPGKGPGQIIQDQGDGAARIAELLVEAKVI